MWDDAVINKPRARSPLFGFRLHGIGSVIGETWRERGYCVFVWMCFRVFIHVATTWSHKCALLVPIYTWLMLRETELERRCVCVMCSLHQ